MSEGGEDGEQRREGVCVCVCVCVCEVKFLRSVSHVTHRALHFHVGYILTITLAW